MAVTVDTYVCIPLSNQLPDCVVAEQAFVASDAARESDFANAVAAVSQCASEKELDHKTEAALKTLDELENGYRSFHAALSARLKVDFDLPSSLFLP